MRVGLDGGAVSIVLDRPAPFAGIGPIAELDGALYFAQGANEPGPIGVVPTDGAAPTLLGQVEDAVAIGIAGSRVYWTQYGPFAQGPALLEMALDGGAITTVAQGLGGGLAFDGSYLYWGRPDDGALVRTPLDGGATETLACGSFAIGVATDATSLYWTDYSGGRVMKLMLH